MAGEELFNFLFKESEDKADTAATILDDPDSRDDASDPESAEEETVAHDDPDHKPVTEPPSAAVTKRNLFTHPDVHPVVLDLALLKMYGAEWLGWEPETLEHLVPQDFKVREISGLAMSKIMACKTLHLVDTYWKQWEVFVWCTMPFNNLYPDFEVLQVPTVSQCLISVDVANRIRDDVEWSEEVKRFIATVYRHDGIFCTIAPTEFVPIDTVNFVIDCDELHKLWPGVRESRKAPTGSSIMDEQLRLLLDVYLTLKASQDTLREQLRLVEDG